MKKINILIIVPLLLTLFSGCQPNRPSEYPAVDMSYEHVLELDDFKCYASYLDESLTVEGETAKELYKIVTESAEGLEHSPKSPQNDSAYLIFYNSTDTFHPSSDNVTEFYGCFHIYPDGLLQFTGAPYISALFSYQLETGLFDSVLKKVFQHTPSA